MGEMQELFAKMGEYVKMDSELPLPEFSAYYQRVMAHLMADYQNMDTDQLVQAKGITMIMAANAKLRALKKDGDRKKYAKIADKADFWQDAIKARLLKDGMTAEELDDRVEKLWAEEAPAGTDAE
ncbi:MAG: hypothetical protein Q4B96_01340 [Bacillota bacterium]|nr:hypothetical protein [Bacillota bacterium]